MYYYEVWVRSARYHGSEALTYCSAQRLVRGSLVKVPLQRQEVPAVVVAQVSKPTFPTKPISLAYGLRPLPEKLLALAQWLGNYYPAPLGIVTQLLVPAGLSDQPPRSAAKEVLNTKIIHPLQGWPPLTPPQATAMQAATRPGTYLLHGITGSGKTRVYIELAARELAAGRSTIVLTPEISLTSQLSERFRQAFAGQVVVLHSGLSPAERRSAWQTILDSTGPLVVIGPRSALFSPLAAVGLIVLDESHEPAYKQEQAPHYQAGRVAAKLAQLHGAILVLGSATPSISDYYLAEQRHRPILEMSELALPETVISSTRPEPSDKQAKPLRSRRDDRLKIEVVDLKDRSLLPTHPYFSRPLLKAIEAALLGKEQVLLYLNRRGTARIILCEGCGWQALCPHCDLPLTYHGDAHQLRCHVCNYHQPTPSSCPACSHPNIIFRAIGTKAVADDIGRLFPGARVQRFDTDNLKAERFEQHFAAVHAGEVDILVGTQLLAKGLDLPRLSTLGVISADTSLAMPDFSANERTYQLLTQVLGRVGRGHLTGTAIIQTYQPTHPALQVAISGEWRKFYEDELESRRLFKFPPFVYLLKLTVRRASSKAAEKAAEDFGNELRHAGLKIEIDGPAPAFHEKFQNKYQWQLVVKAKDRSQLLQALKLIPKSNWSYDIDPIDLL